jgi:hypothetical protein
MWIYMPPSLEAMVHSNVWGFLWISAVLKIIKYYKEAIAVQRVA